MKKYVIRFESGKRIATIATDNPIDLKNKKVQAEAWARGDSKRKVIVASDNRNYIKLVSGKIKAMTQAEINKLLEEQKNETPEETVLKALGVTKAKWEKIKKLV
jgi:hypothetical protein